MTTNLSLTNNTNKDKLSLSNITLNKQMIPNLVHNMLNVTLYHKMLDIIDSKNDEDYSYFSDLEMIYLFVHEEKDQDERKNRTKETKQEYLRELLWIYDLFMNHGEIISFHLSNLDIYSIFKNIERKHIRKFQDWLKIVPNGKGNKPYSVATIARKTGIFKSFLTFLYHKKYITKPLHATFKSANIHRRDRPNRDLYTEEAIQLLHYYEKHPIVFGFLSVLLTTGARIREISTARICDLSYDGDGHWLEVIGKGNEKRELFIFPNVFQAIIDFRKRRGLETNLNKNDKSFLFVTARHRPYSYKYLSKYLSDALSRADLPFINDENRSITPHTLRHGFAIISAEEGADIFRIMQALGHKKIETTMIYLEKHEQRKNHVAKKWKNSSIIQSF